MSVAERILTFYRSLNISNIPEDVEVLNPYLNEETFEYCSKFYNKFYHDNTPRKLILGINPGRFGGGVTGVPFTDPVKLETHCGITNSFDKRTELSADFVYQVIDAFGGAAKFYQQFFIGAVCPLGFVKDGKNMNYYDDYSMQKNLEEFIIEGLLRQIEITDHPAVCFCMGEGKNFNFLKSVNEKHGFFKSIVPLPHPRFIMQYKRKKVQEYIKRYRDTLG